MDTRTSSSTPLGANGTGTRRKRRNADDASIRISCPSRDLRQRLLSWRQEIASEGEALIQALKSGQTFYTLTAWKAVPEVNGRGSPVIVKQALARTKSGPVPQVQHNEFSEDQ